jgi:hypothetical protein
LVDPSIWFNIFSGRLDILELLRTDDIEVVTVMQNPDGTTTRQYRIVRPTDTLQSVAKSVHVPLKGWAAEVLPPPTTDRASIRLLDDRAKSSLDELGAVPGSTIRFFAQEPERGG